MSTNCDFLAISYPRTHLGRKLSQVGDGGRGVTLLTKGGSLPPLFGLMQVCIISCIKDPKSARADFLRNTIANYTGDVFWDIFILIPLDLVDIYKEILDGLKVNLVAYEVHETTLSKKHKFYRCRNVGDARNASLALGVALGLKKLLVSDDDRCYNTPYFNYRYKIDKYFWCNPDKNSIKDAKAIHHFKDHCNKLFSKNKNLAVLGFSSYNRRRCWKGEEIKEKTPIIFTQGKQHCAQLVMLNIELLNKQEITYLPIRMGEDTAFQYMLMEKGFLCLESSHLAHNSPPASSCESIARSKKNAYLSNYTDRDIFYLKQFFNCGCVNRTGTKKLNKFYFQIRWCPKGQEVSMPNFIAVNSKRSNINKLENLNDIVKKFREERKKLNKKTTDKLMKLKKKVEEDPRLGDDEDVMDKDFDFDEFMKRELDDESAGWQMMGELLHQMLLAGHIQQVREVKPKEEKPKVSKPIVTKPNVSNSRKQK